MEKIRIHNAETGEIIDRDRTPEEQAEVDAERSVILAQPRDLIAEIEELKVKVRALELSR